MTPAISVVGLGKLGACLAACLASRGFNVIGVDLDAAVVAKVNDGRSPTLEPQLEELIAANHKRLSATHDYLAAVLETDVTFILVPTPSLADGAFSLEHVAEAAREIGRALAKKDGYHLVVVTSTVLPGSTDYVVRAILESESGKSCGRDFGLCYNPEFVALGSVIRDLLNPDFILIGESDERAGDTLAACYRMLLNAEAPIARMNLINAEISKLSVNTYVTMKITYANMLAELCEQLPGADVDVVTQAIGLDTRIGRKYLRGAISYGGPCFPRDNVAFSHLAGMVGKRARLAEIVNSENERFISPALTKIIERVPGGAKVAVLGISYKPGSIVTEASPGLEIARLLADAGYEVSAFDPLPVRIPQKSGKLALAPSLEEALDGAAAAVIVNPDPCFSNDAFIGLLKRYQPAMIFDFWRLLRSHAASLPGIEVVSAGVGPSEASPGFIESLAATTAGMLQQKTPGLVTIDSVGDGSSR